MCNGVLPEMRTKDQLRNRKKHARRRERKEAEARERQKQQREARERKDAPPTREREERRDAEARRDEEESKARDSVTKYESELYPEQDYAAAPLLEEWSLGVERSYAFSPLLVHRDVHVLSGVVRGARVVTSALVWIDRECARTESGHLYRLGAASAEYLSLRLAEHAARQVVWFPSVHL